MKTRQDFSRSQDEGGHRVDNFLSTRRRQLVLLVLISGLAMVWASHQGVVAATEQTAEPVASKDVPTLLKQLTDDSYPTREKAMRELWQLGEAALPELRKIHTSQDPEASARAGELILYIGAGVLIDSPEEVKQLVIQFSRSNVGEKVTILRKLLELKQWKQVLHLARFEKDAEAREQMAAIVKTTAGMAARDAISKGEMKLAEEILELTKGDVQGMLMRAWFYVRQGQFKEQIAKASSLSGNEAALWKMCLYRANGDLTDAIREARKAGLQETADGLKLLIGDVLPWLQRTTQQKDLDVIYSKACRIQIHRLQGQEKQAASLARELLRLANNEDDSRRVANALAANGYPEFAIDALKKHNVEAAFSYYDATESPELCLKVLGIPEGAKPPFTDWVKTFTEKAIEEEDDQLYERLILLADFMVSRGERQHTLAILTPIMKALQEDGSDDWFELIGKMAAVDPQKINYSLGAEAIHFLKNRGNEDGEADLGVRKILEFIPTKSRKHIWERLKKRNESDIAKSLEEIGLLAGLLEDPDDKASKLQQSLLAEVADADLEDKQARQAALYSFCIHRNDIPAAAHFADLLKGVNDRWLRKKNDLDEGLLRWDVIEPVIRAQAEEYPGNYYVLTKWFIVLEKLGRKKEAAEVLDRVLMLTFGSADVINRLGYDLYETGFQDQAAEFWFHAAAMAEPGEQDFDSAIYYLARFGQSLYKKGKWKQAAATSEACCQMLVRGSSEIALQSILRVRHSAEFTKGMALLKSGKKSAALKTLDHARKLIPGDGSLADEFFPILNKKNLGKTYDKWFEDSYRHVQQACKRYPNSHNSHNTAAWLAARAVKKLDAAHAHAEQALKQRPMQGAYLDTMAEVWFARGKRAKAIEWSQKATEASISRAQGTPRSEMQVRHNYQQLNLQLERFKNDPLPGARPSAPSDN